MHKRTPGEERERVERVAMLFGFVQSWLKPGANPIGVDFGTDALRLAQVEAAPGGEYRLVAAASADVPNHVRTDAAARFEFFVESVRELLTSGNFRGRKSVLALPAASMFIQHLRMPKLDETEMRKALPFEAAGKLPIDPGLALLRHVVAGEVHHDQEVKNEVVVMAANRELVNGLLGSAAKAKLDVVGMNVEPKALLDCFANVYRRKTDADVTNCFVDIGAVATRAVIARGSQILFARVIPVGGDHFNRAVANALKISTDDAKALRIKLAQEAPQAQAPVVGPAAPVPAAARATDIDENNSFALLGAGLSAASKQNREAASGTTAVLEAPARVPHSQAETESARVERACREPLARLVEELGLCRRYYESCFPSAPVDRLVFVGGEARQTWVCQSVAREMVLSAQLGDPLVRMAKTCELPPESGIDLKQPQPAWAVAIGLSMGSTTGDATAK
jgi:type IV pilus assembly protein PilM